VARRRATPTATTVVLSIMGREVFGEMALLDGAPRSATVSTIDACNWCDHPGHSSVATSEADPRQSLMKSWRAHSRLTAARRTPLLDVESHLANVCLRWPTRFGDHSRSGQTAITLKLSQQELASRSRDPAARARGCAPGPIAASSSWSGSAWHQAAAGRWEACRERQAEKTTTTTSRTRVTGDWSMGFG